MILNLAPPGLVIQHFNKKFNTPSLASSCVVCFSLSKIVFTNKVVRVYLAVLKLIVWNFMSDFKETAFKILVLLQTT